VWSFHWVCVSLSWQRGWQWREKSGPPCCQGSQANTTGEPSLLHGQFLFWSPFVSWAYKLGIYCCGTARPRRKGFLKVLSFQKLTSGAYREDTISLGFMVFLLQWAGLTGVECQPFICQETLLAVSQLWHARMVDSKWMSLVPCPSFISKVHGQGWSFCSTDQNLFSCEKIKEGMEKALWLWTWDLSSWFFTIMIKANSQSSQEFIDYCLDVAWELIGQRSFCQKSGWPPSLPLSEIDEVRLSNQRHFSEVTGKRKDCVICARKAAVES